MSALLLVLPVHSFFKESFYKNIDADVNQYCKKLSEHTPGSESVKNMFIVKKRKADFTARENILIQYFERHSLSFSGYFRNRHIVFCFQIISINSGTI